MRMPSWLNAVLDVPTTPAAVSPTVPITPCPRAPMHATDVAVVQLVVLQSARARTDVCVASATLNSTPSKETLAVPEQTLVGVVVVIAGAVRQNIQRLPTCRQ